MFSSTLIVILISVCCLCSDKDYYWKEYFGTVPDDAFVAGKNLDDRNVYIGQGYVKSIGLIVGQIVPGVRELQVSYGGTNKTAKYVKVLCGAQENFYWMKAKYDDLHLLLTDKHAVIGGHQDDYDGHLNIGRIRKNGDLKIGKVATFWLEKAWFFYNDNGTERMISSYEILLFKPQNPYIILR